MEAQVAAALAIALQGASALAPRDVSVLKGDVLYRIREHQSPKALKCYPSDETIDYGEGKPRKAPCNVEQSTSILCEVASGIIKGSGQEAVDNDNKNLWTREERQKRYDAYHKCMTGKESTFLTEYLSCWYCKRLRGATTDGDYAYQVKKGQISWERFKNQRKGLGDKEDTFWYYTVRADNKEFGEIKVEEKYVKKIKELGENENPSNDFYYLPTDPKSQNFGTFDYNGTSYNSDNVMQLTQKSGSDWEVTPVSKTPIPDEKGRDSTFVLCHVTMHDALKPRCFCVDDPTNGSEKRGSPGQQIYLASEPPKEIEKLPAIVLPKSVQCIISLKDGNMVKDTDGNTTKDTTSKKHCAGRRR